MAMHATLGRCIEGPDLDVETSLLIRCLYEDLVEALACPGSTPSWVGRRAQERGWPAHGRTARLAPHLFD